MKLCQGTKKILGNQMINAHSKEVLNRFRPSWPTVFFNLERPTGIKRIRMVCPTCKRRLIASVSTCEDGCCLYFSIPPHKPRSWWKKKKARW
jgi:hypothetical protein